MLKKVDLEEENERDCCCCEVLGLGICTEGSERVEDEIAISIELTIFVWISLLGL